MTPQTKLILEIVAFALLLGVIGLAVSSYLAEHEAKIKLQATLEAQGQAQKQYQQVFADLQKQMSDRDAAYQSQLKTLDSKFQTATSPQQVVALVSQLMGLKEPVQITTPAPTAANPNPTPVVTVPSIDFPQVKAYAQACEECKLNLTKTQADLQTREQQAVIAQKQIDSIKNERDVAIKAAKGTFWGNLKIRAKWMGIGLIVGGAMAAAAHH